MPFSFTLGSDEILDVFNEGLAGMREGERRELITPADPDEGAATDRVYVIELVSVEPPEEPLTPNPAKITRVKGTGPKPTTETPPGPPPKELVVKELKPGSGKEVEIGERLGVRYLGVKYKSGLVDDRWNEDPPYSFVLGQGEVREGWEIGLQGMKLGARRELRLPSELAYGTGAILYTIELIEMEERQPENR